jgi:hypothetical protein
VCRPAGGLVAPQLPYVSAAAGSGRSGDQPLRHPVVDVDEAFEVPLEVLEQDVDPLSHLVPLTCRTAMDSYPTDVASRTGCYRCG